MSDWGMYELEDIVWDEFGESDDHIVPQPGGEEVDACLGQGDCHKKLWHEAVNAVGRRTDNKKLGNSFHGKKEPHSVAKDESAPGLDTDLWSDPPESDFTDLYDISCPDKVAGLVSKEATISDNCFKTSNIKSVDSIFCRDDPILENRDAMTGSNLCRFSLVGISLPDGNPAFLGNEDEDKESTNLLDYGWPDVNFEDVDRMFRNCDFTFGQGNTSASEELLWAGREDFLSSDFRSSTSETSVLKSKLKQSYANMDFIPCDQLPVLPECDKKAESSTFQTLSWTSDTDKPTQMNYYTFTNQLDTDLGNKNESAWKEQPLECNGKEEVKVLSQSQTSDLMGHQETDMVNMQRNQSMGQNQSEEGNKGQTSVYSRSISSLPTRPMKQLPNQKQPMSMPSSLEVVSRPVIASPKLLWEPDSFRYPQNYIPYMPSGCRYPSNQIPAVPPLSSIKSENQSPPGNSGKLSHFLNHDRSLSRSQESPSKTPSMTPQEKIEKLRRRQQVQAAFAIGHQQQHFVTTSLIVDNHHVQEQPYDIRNEVTFKDEVEERSVEQSTVEVDSSTAQESSCMSSMLPDELSLEENSFHQLQDVMAQLDIRTKLCIRDSLYRLARSAEQRQRFSGVSCSSRDGKERNGAFVTEEPYKYDQLQSNRYTGSVDMETNTNPIDRSIAHLLFHRPSDSYTVPANDSLSLESNIIVSIDK